MIVDGWHHRKVGSPGPAEYHRLPQVQQDLGHHAGTERVAGGAPFAPAIMNPPHRPLNVSDA